MAQLMWRAFSTVAPALWNAIPPERDCPCPTGLLQGLGNPILFQAWSPEWVTVPFPGFVDCMEKKILAAMCF